MNVLPSRIRRTITRPPEHLLDKLQIYPTTIVSDCLNRLGCMRGLQRFGSAAKMCGPAITVEEAEGGNLMSHVALELLKEGDVLVVDAKAITSRACLGGLQVRSAANNGAAGIVVDGAIRDANSDLRIPIFARDISPAGPLKGWGGNINFPIACCGVVVRPGDIVVGDPDGVVVVPQERIEDLLPACHDRTCLECCWAEDIQIGASTLDAVGLRDNLAALSIRYED